MNECGNINRPEKLTHYLVGNMNEWTNEWINEWVNAWIKTKTVHKNQ